MVASLHMIVMDLVVDVVVVWVDTEFVITFFLFNFLVITLSV